MTPLLAVLLVAAASDLAELQQPLAQAFRRATGLEVRFTTGSSGMLARQIENGAPFDVYLSANEQFVRDLAARGQILPSSVTLYARGRLGLWSQPPALRDLDGLKASRIRRIAIANPAHAPYGLAAQQALEKAGLWTALKDKVVFGENVRQAWEFASSGNADAVITSWTLVHDRGGLLLPETLHAPIRQAGGIVASSPNPTAAHRFLDFLRTPEARAIFARHGLFTPESR